MRLCSNLVATALCVLVCLTSNEAAARDQLLQMVTGQQRIISVPGVTRIAIANPAVADVKVTGTGEVLVTAIGDGHTELTIWRGSRITKYQVIVTTMDPKQLRREVERLVGDREGIKIRIVRDQVFIEGRVLTLSDLERAEEAASLYPQVRNMVQLDPSAHSHIAAAINKQLDRLGLTKARATVVGKTIFLEGTVDSEADMKKADIITQGMGSNVQSVLTIGPSRMIEIDVEFVEVAVNSLHRIGIDWPTDITGNLTLEYARADVIRGTAPNSETFDASAAATASFGMALHFADGISRVLARPRLVAGSNQEASFLAGGEVPIPLISQDRIYVEFKEYGVRLKITPTADATGTIQTKILVEISQIDESVSVRGIPGFLVRRVDTQVTVRDGETIVLSGLFQLSDGKDVSKVPFLGHLPIIGELFKSRRFMERRSELVIFVTLRLVDPVSRHLRKVIRDMRRRYEEAEGDVSYSLFD